MFLLRSLLYLPIVLYLRMAGLLDLFIPLGLQMRNLVFLDGPYKGKIEMNSDKHLYRLVGGPYNGRIMESPYTSARRFGVAIYPTMGSIAAIYVPCVLPRILLYTTQPIKDIKGIPILIRYEKEANW